MEEGLIAACSQLRLTEDEQETITLEDVIDDNADAKAELCLVGKLLTQKPYNLAHMKNALTSAWRLAKGFTIRDIGDELFVLEFYSKVDRNRILREGPWNFDKQLILLEPMSGNMQPNNMILKHCLVWVRIYNLPMNCRGMAAITKIGSKIGRIVEVDGESGECNRYGRVRVNLDVSRPIYRGTKVINPLGEQCWIPFKYERVQNFCYWCGMLDHLVAECEEKPKETEVSDWPYGPGLRATPRKRSLMGNRYVPKTTYKDQDGQTTSGSQSDNAEKSRAAKRSLNLNDNLEAASDARENTGPQQVVARVNGDTSENNTTAIGATDRLDVDGLVEVCIQQVQPGEGKKREVMGSAKPFERV
ncbi:uncharacterized protein LOC126661845 [Mercurialis annua]|uniref:uncharacterized protein LOC126661845 n=1 Tax=Mercurialis annua TaxID=3986 RepID=UPI00215DF04A|nr:uncharacterized protein LOC126661845 [Mercurialis annua]